mgnify:CR=1 FL=1
MKKQTYTFDKEKALQKISNAFSKTDKFKDFSSFILFLHFSFPEFLPFSNELFAAVNGMESA